jgi:hypothetical protein
MDPHELEEIAADMPPKNDSGIEEPIVDDNVDSGDAGNGGEHLVAENTAASPRGETPSTADSQHSSGENDIRATSAERPDTNPDVQQHAPDPIPETKDQAPDAQINAPVALPNETHQQLKLAPAVAQVSKGTGTFQSRVPRFPVAKVRPLLND